MATASPYPLSFKQALQDASAKTARIFEIVVTLDPEHATPYRVALRKPNTPLRKEFAFANVAEAEHFLRELAAARG